MRPWRSTVLALAVAILAPSGEADAAGARLYKSGPIQITADGAWVWVANDEQDTVTRIETATGTATEIALPDPGDRHRPRGLSVKEDGSEVWVACHDSDRLYVLAPDGSLLSRIDLPWGSGPYGIALSRDQSRALVTLHRAEALALVDVASRTVTHRLAPVYWSPLGVAWLEDGVSAWVTHLFADGEDPFLTRVDVSGPEPEVTTKLIVKSTNPKHSTNLTAPHQIAEGGYLTFRGHLAQIPSASGRSRVWIPTQYNNINETAFSADSTIQSTIRTLDVGARLIPNTNADKVILTAVHVHDPAPANGAYVGPGWDARVSGPVDLAFSTDGSMAWVLFEQSNDILAMPTATPAFKPGPTTPALPEIPVGARPMGLAVSPVADVAYAWNSLDATVSVVDLAAQAEIGRITASSAPPFADPRVLAGARLFHASDDAATPGAISSNSKIACASCHPHGEHDGRTWDNQNLPGIHGPRASMSLLGLSQTFQPVTPGSRGQLHRSGDRDEVQDFDFTYQSVMMEGTGYLGGGGGNELDTTLNAGVSPQLDDIAAYLMALEPVPRSPFRTAGGALSPAAVRGATFFVGTDPRGHVADSGCAGCHVPETGFVDFQFHDVGQRRAGPERELNLLGWTVNTPTLVGAWTTPPYDGVSTWATTLTGVVKDLAGRTTHGTPGGLTGRQLMDLAELVASIDGNTTAAELRGARDVAPPRVSRVSPTSPTRIEVWFDESVDPSAASPAAWRVARAGGPDVPVTGATWDPQNGDRITLRVDRLETSCSPVTYLVIPQGAVPDMADRATGGTANLLDVADPSNTHSFQLGSTITITMGASGYENVTVGVHDAAVVQGLTSWSHGSVWLGVGGGTSNTGFVRFDWTAPFLAATGVASSADIVDASFSLHPEWGNVNTIEARRLLKSWRDTGHGDWSSSHGGAPTWNEAGAGRPWGTPNAGRTAAGVEGRSPSDYNGANDTARTPDAVVDMVAINERLVIGGAGVTDAARFWLDNPSLDYGYALRVQPRSSPWYHEAKFDSSHVELAQHGPVLTITYAIPATTSIPPREVSGSSSGAPLLVARDPGGLRLRFEDLVAGASSYSVYEGSVGPVTARPGDWYSHQGAACNAAPSASAGRLEMVVAPAAGGRYYLVTASDACLEGPSGEDSFRQAHAATWLDCLP